MESRPVNNWLVRIAALAAPILFILLIWLAVGDFRAFRDGPDAETIASASLKGIREQNRLTAFAANYSARRTYNLRTTPPTEIHPVLQWLGAVLSSAAVHVVLLPLVQGCCC